MGSKWGTFWMLKLKMFNTLELSGKQKKNICKNRHFYAMLVIIDLKFVFVEIQK